MKRYVKPGNTVLDIGANVGYFTLLAASLVGESGRVIAIEPEPHNFDVLTLNLRDNDCRHVTPINCALGEEMGAKTLSLSQNNLGDHRLSGAAISGRHTIDVQVQTADDTLATLGVARVDVVKMDVQGYEHRVLRGMQRLLSQPFPLVILTEVWPYGIVEAGGDPIGFLRAFTEHGFVLSFLRPDGRDCPVSPEEVLSAIGEIDGERPDDAFINIVAKRA